MEPAASHRCRFHSRIAWLDWAAEGALRERQGRARSMCDVCQRVRPERRPMPPGFLEREAVEPSHLALDQGGRELALVLLRRSAGVSPRPVRYAGFIGAANRLGLSASVADDWIERLLGAGCVCLRSRRRGARWEPMQLQVCRSDHLEELVAPGGRAGRIAALAEARRATAELAHPVAGEVRRVLADSSAERLDPRVVRALAAVARHAETGEILSGNVFSARYLGSAKELRRVRGRLERFVGRLETLGIREGAAILLLGGVGSLRCQGAPAIDLGHWRPFVGIARETAAATIFEFPSGGVLVIENLAVFEACCRGEVQGIGDWLFVWSAGYPGRAVRAVVERAHAAEVPIRIWADLDLDGVCIARLIHSWAPEACQPFRMAPGDLAAASTSQAVTPRALARIEAELVANPRLLLAETLRAIRDLGHWVEQEALLR